MDLNISLSGRRDYVQLAKNSIILRKVKAGTTTDQAVNYQQVFGDGNTFPGANTYSGNNTFSGTTAFTGNVTLAGAKSIKSAADSDQYVPFMPTDAQQAITDAGAANVTSYCTKWTTTGAAAGTLADGTQIGQLKKVQLIVDAGDLTLTPANLANGSTITFADAGDFAILLWNGTDWYAIELGNDADGATAPVLA